MRDRAPHRQWDSLGRRFPVRTCVACRARRAQADLLRVVRGVNGGIMLDPERLQPGRGWYVCSDKLECRSVKSLGRFARSDAAALAQRLEVFYDGQLHSRLQSTESVMSQ